MSDIDLTCDLTLHSAKVQPRHNQIFSDFSKRQTTMVADAFQAPRCVHVLSSLHFKNIYKAVDIFHAPRSVTWFVVFTYW
jgi:hypothetical protein